MYRLTGVLLSLLIIGLLLAGVSCGGGTGVGLDSNRDVQGITEGGFNLVRYDDQGNPSNALNPTLDIKVTPGGAETTVTIAIEDLQPMQSVALDLHYDPTRFSPTVVEFDDLIDTPVELAITSVGGLVALGQSSIDGAAARRGQFATIVFRNEPMRSVSGVNDAHDKPINIQYSANGFTAEGFTATATGGVINFDILGIFTSLSGDGDQNGVSNISDITPLGAMFNRSVSPTDAMAARADYDENGLVTINDITPLGANFNEITTGIEVLVGEDGSDEAGLTVAATYAWTDGNPPESPATVTANPQDIWRHWAGTIDAATLDSADADNDNLVCITARATTSTATGVDAPAFPCIEVNFTGGGGNGDFNVESVTFEVNGNEVGDGDTVSLIANSDVTFAITGFDGKYNGVDFDPSTLNGASSPTQAEYDAELAAIQADFANAIANGSSQQLNPGGFAGFETDKTAVLLNLIAAGSTVTGTVFPDDDPGNNAEGSLTLDFGNTNNPGVVTVTLDVTPDGDAPVVTSIGTSNGQDGNNNWIVTNVDSSVKGKLTFPGGDPVPVDGTTVDVELVDLTNNLIVPIDFTYVAGTPDAAGEFTLTADIINGGYDFNVIVGSGAVLSGNLYMLRFFSPPGEHGSSVNKPGEFLTGGAIDTNIASRVMPGSLDLTGKSTIDATENTIVIVPTDPEIRRLPQLDKNTADNTTPPTYPGYNDMLKGNGDTFPVTVFNGTVWPVVVIQQGTDPNTISSTAEPTNGIFQTETNPHRIVIDILALTDPGVGFTESWVYKVFGQPSVAGDLSSRPVITTGSFNITNFGLPPDNAPLVGVDFGVNIFDDPVNGEGTRDLANLNSAYFANKDLNLARLPLVATDDGNADVLFVQFSGGEIFPSTTNFKGYTENFSNELILHNDAIPQDTKEPIDVRIVGVGSPGIDYIGLVHLDQGDLFPAGALVEGFDYEVRLNDPANGPAFDDTIATGLLHVHNTP